MSNAKRNALLLLFVFGLLTILLAMSLPNLVLGVGKPFSLGQPQSMFFGTSPLPRSELPVLIIRGILALALIFFPFSLIYALTTADGRRRLLMYAVLMLIALFAADYLRNQNQAVEQAEQAMMGTSVQNLLAADTNPPAIFTPTPPASLTAAVMLAIAITAAVLIVGAVWFLRRKQVTETPLQRLAVEVQNAIESLNTGGDLTTTIVHCYQEMSRVVQEQRGIARQITMTPHEFEDQLVGIGLPQAPIKTLTGLFERVRYGNTPVGTHEENLALACLTDIVNACNPKALA
jgi:hypothetical protein